MYTSSEKSKMDYNRVLEHFKKNGKSKIIKTNGKRNLIIMDINNKEKDKTTPMRVIVPAEAATERAESRLKEDIKEEDDKKSNHSVQRCRRSRKSTKRKAEKEVKEVKDIFNKRWRRQ